MKDRQCLKAELDRRSPEELYRSGTMLCSVAELQLLGTGLGRLFRQELSGSGVMFRELGSRLKVKFQGSIKWVGLGGGVHACVLEGTSDAGLSHLEF